MNMKEFDYIESILELIEKRFQLSRRNFVKSAALFHSGLLLSLASSLALGGCEKKTSPAGSSVRERQDRAELVIVATGVRACRVITLESLTCLKELLGTNTPNRTLREHMTSSTSQLTAT